MHSGYRSYRSSALATSIAPGGDDRSYLAAAGSCYCRYDLKSVDTRAQRPVLNACCADRVGCTAAVLDGGRAFHTNFPTGIRHAAARGSNAD